MRINIPAFKKARVLVVGDLMLDRYWHGPTSRISPEAPVPVVRVDEIEERPGGAGNVALNVATLGSQCTVIGLTGDDEDSHALERHLRSSNVQCSFLRLYNGATITKLRVISRHQQLIRLDFENDFSDYKIGDLIREFKHQLAQCDIVVLSDYGKGCLLDVQQLIDLARQQNIPVLVDPKGNDFGKYRNATMITPNLSEFEAVAGRCSDESELLARGEQLREQLNLQALLITRSEHGMTLLERGQSALHIPARAREVYDVTGAGDTVIGVFAAAVAVGVRIADAAVLANAAAGVVVGKLGTAGVSINELQHALHDEYGESKGIVEEDYLLDLVRECQARGERVVMTNGCFDILHPGHVNYLEKARKLGDRLIVAVNDDMSVRRLKGDSRPINDILSRMTVLSALKSVDWVVPFAEDTPERLICRLLPDVLVKGGDYRKENIAGGKCVLEKGGIVEIMPFVDGCSTSQLINTIKSSS